MWYVFSPMGDMDNNFRAHPTGQKQHIKIAMFKYGDSPSNLR